MRLPALLIAAAVAALAICAPETAPAAAAPISACASGAGTIVAVDFVHWGGPIVRGCDTGAPDNGVTLLRDSGFATTGTQRNQAFLCRIGNTAFRGGTQYPTDDPCIVTPPASAYWAFWTAAAGQNRWTYSTTGAYSHTPGRGEIELWTFGGTSGQSGGGNPSQGYPAVTPNSLRTVASTPRTTSPPRAPISRPPPRPKTSHRSQPVVAPGSANQSPRQPRTAVRSDANTAGPTRAPGSRSATAPGPSASVVVRSAAESSSESTAGSASSRRTADTVAGSPVVVDARPMGSTSDSGKSAAALIVGLALAALVGAGGGFAVWQRRRGAD